MNPLAPLVNLVADLFTPEELRMLIRATPDIGEILDHLPGPDVGSRLFIEAAVDACHRRGLVASLLGRLVEERPRRAEEIGAVASDLGIPIRVGEIRVQLAKRQQEALKHLEDRAADFVAASKKDLGERERSYRRIAYSLYGAGFLFGAAGAAFAIWRAVSAQQLISGEGNGWGIAELALLSAVGLGLVVAVEEYCRKLGRLFMNEATRNADRIHAISFGEFYLRAYGQSAQWPEVKEAFQHWNIGEKSAFHDAEASGIDPQVIQLAVELAKLVPGLKK